MHDKILNDYLENRRKVCRDCGEEIGYEWWDEHDGLCEGCENKEVKDE